MVLRKTGKSSKGRGDKPKFDFDKIQKRRTVEAVRERASRKSNRFDSPFKQGFDTFRPAVGTNVIRFLPPTWDEADHFGYKVWMHPYVGERESIYVCPKMNFKKRCPICEAAQEAKKAHDDDDAKSLSPQERVIYWVLDREDRDKENQPLIWSVAWTKDRDITGMTVEEKRNSLLYVDHAEQGYDFIFTRIGQGLNTRYSGEKFEREASPISEDPDVTDKVLDYITENPLTDVLHVYPADYLESIMSGTTTEADEDLDEEEEEDKKVVHLNKRRKAAAKDEDEDEDEPEEEDEEEDDEEDEKPRRGSKRKYDDDEDERPVARGKGRDADEEPDDDEDDDEDERPSQRKAVSKTKHKADDDDARTVRPKRSSDTTREVRGSRRTKDEEERPRERVRPTDRRR